MKIPKGILRSQWYSLRTEVLDDILNSLFVMEAGATEHAEEKALYRKAAESLAPLIDRLASQQLAIAQMFKKKR